jgi:hypothetical protein
MIKPTTRLYKFKDTTTSVQFRKDGNLLLVGENKGQVQLFEINNKFVLRSYDEFKK